MRPMYSCAHLLALLELNWSIARSRLMIGTSLRASKSLGCLEFGCSSLDELVVGFIRVVGSLTARWSVDGGRRHAGTIEQRLAVRVVIFVGTEPGVQSGRLIVQSGIDFAALCSAGVLAESHLARNVTILLQLLLLELHVLFQSHLAFALLSSFLAQTFTLTCCDIVVRFWDSIGVVVAIILGGGSCSRSSRKLPLTFIRSIISIVIILSISQSAALHAGLVGQFAELLLALFLLLDCELLLDLRAELDFLPGLAFRNVQTLRQRGEVRVDGVLTQTTTVGGETLVERDGVPARVLPVTDAGGDVPLVALFLAELLGRCVQDWHGIFGRSARGLDVLVLRRLHGIHLLGHHLDDTLRGGGVVPRRIGTRRVLDELRVLFDVLGGIGIDQGRSGGRVQRRLGTDQLLQRRLRLGGSRLLLVLRRKRNIFLLGLTSHHIIMA
mmetsp:Transcript_8280/g.23821  ORF Transcript_8280/g.23821 Transcript_8280/m.23821 type:complete len:440 (+) Transcript_8280:126-1445(+)